MKKIFLCATIAVAMCFASCEGFDASEILDRLDNLENQLDDLKNNEENNQGGDNSDNPGGGDDIPADKTQAITFADPTTKLICILQWDENEDGELSYEEAAAVTDLGTAFKGSSILAFTELKYFTSLEKIADSAFEGCVSLVKITMPEQLTTIGTSALKGCTNLKKIAIPNAVTEIGGNAFSGCSSLTRVDLSDLSVWCKIGFGGSSANPLCNGAKLYLNGSELVDITIPSDITEIKAYIFSGCTSLTSITIPDSVTSIGGYAFYGCTGELIINNKKLVETNYTYYSCPMNSSNGWLYGSKFTKLTIGNSVTSIGNYAFWECTSLTSVTIPNSVTEIGERAFSDCTSLTSVTIPDSVTSIGDLAFYGCTSLTRVNITDLSAWCKINFSSSSANPLCNGAKLYLNGSELTDITIPSDIAEIKIFAFRGCISLTSVTIPDSVTEIGYNAFSDCTSLTSVTIGNSVTSIGNDAFRDCTSLTSVTIPDSVTLIGNDAFRDCTSLTSVTIGNSVTSIGDNAFFGCTSLTSVTIGNSVTSIGDNAFFGCTSLKEIYCKPTTPPAIYWMYLPYTDPAEVGSFPFNGGMKIYVPRNSYDAYMQYSSYSNDQVAQKNWCMYESYIEPYDFE